MKKDFLLFLFAIIFSYIFLGISIREIEKDSFSYNQGMIRFFKEDNQKRNIVYSFTKDNKIQEAVMRSHYKHDIDPKLICSVMAVESNFDSTAVSRVGAIGLMQIMEPTIYLMKKSDLIFNKEYNIFSVKDNVDLGTSILKYEISKFSLEPALAAYNAGHRAGVMWAFNRESLPEETRNYVPKVMLKYDGEI